MKDYNFDAIAARILSERYSLYVSRGKSNHYNRNAEGYIIYAHKPTEGYKQATQKDILNIANDLGHHLGRNSLSNIENGVKDASTLSLAELTTLSTIFDCEVGYLLCEQDEKHRSTTDVMDAVGLSSDAVEVLEKFRKTSGDDITLPILSFCLADEDGSYTRMLMEQISKFFSNAADDDKLVCLMHDADALKIIQGILTLLRDDYIKTHSLDSLDNLSNKLRVYDTVDRDTPSHYDGLPEGTKQFIRDIAKEYDLHLPDDDFSQASRDIVAKFCKKHPDVVSNYIAAHTKQRV